MKMYGVFSVACGCGGSGELVALFESLENAEICLENVQPDASIFVLNTADEHVTHFEKGESLWKQNPDSGWTWEALSDYTLGFEDVENLTWAKDSQDVLNKVKDNQQ